NFYPLGSCTMKFNSRAAHKYASLAGFLVRHPYASAQSVQGTLECLYDLQNLFKELTGMTGVSLAPMAGAHGEFAGVAMIKA
ncbi:aminomethyl-transferring glycine dehydrogenase subunit GcvPB, partial [Francisella tularensis subsp. holarctica]|nr:aminomethyl-transferring glycine dehydrogenase subunit GcvPB [Francisella tularensis subsp. holarctica]